MDNQVAISGGLGRDPELKYTAGGRALATLGVAVERRWQQKDGTWTGETSWFNVSCWGDLAEHVAETFTKGMRVVVIGRLQQRSWETDDGQKRSVVDIVAEDIGPSLKWATATVQKHQRDKYDTKGPSQTDQAEQPPAQGYVEGEPF